MNHEHIKDCIFCAALQQEDGPENLVIHRNPRAFVILNRFPYTNGHLMVVPTAHQSSLDILGAESRNALMDLIAHSVQVLSSVYAPQGFNVGANIGAVAGAGVVDHFHFHIVPRWGGDTNFMTTVAEARVLPETLADTYIRLRQAWKE